MLVTTGAYFPRPSVTVKTVEAGLFLGCVTAWWLTIAPRVLSLYDPRHSSEPGVSHVLLHNLIL
jgi:hypothetical protein